MTITSKITKRGQTTLPDEVLKRLRASAGDVLKYELTDEGILLSIKQTNLDEALESYLGAFSRSGYPDPKDAIMRSRQARGWDDNDEKLFDKWAKE